MGEEVVVAAAVGNVDGARLVVEPKPAAKEAEAEDGGGSDESEQL